MLATVVGWRVHDDGWSYCLEIDQGRYVTKRDLVKYGYTDECQACTQFASGIHNAKVFMTTGAEIALASSWRRTMTRDTLSECLGLLVQKLKSRVQKPEKRWTLVNRRLIFHSQFKNQFPRFEWVDYRAQNPSWIRFKTK